jgi:hypothetical protein
VPLHRGGGAAAREPLWNAKLRKHREALERAEAEMQRPFPEHPPPRIPPQELQAQRTEARCQCETQQAAKTATSLLAKAQIGMTKGESCKNHPTAIWKSRTKVIWDLTFKNYYGDFSFELHKIHLQAAENFLFILKLLTSRTIAINVGKTKNRKYIKESLIQSACAPAAEKKSLI